MFEQPICSSVFHPRTDETVVSALTNPHVHVDPYNRDGQHFIDLVQDFDANLLVQWGRDRLHSSESFYPIHLMPDFHFQRVQAPLTPNPSAPPTGQSNKKKAAAKRPASAMTADFVSAKPLFELVNAPQTEKAIFLHFSSATPNGTRMPVLPNPDGKSALICLSSSVGPPFNKCNLAQCFRNQTSRTRNPRYQTQEGPTPFCHVDFNQPYWANLPEASWAPVVQYLRLPGVSASIRPSEFLKARTPSTPW